MRHHRAVSHENPTAEDHESLLNAILALTEAGWRKASLNDQVEAWSQLVDAVEVGYTMTIDDYTNDLAVREWLERVQPMLTPMFRASLAARLSPFDERFRTATVEPQTRMPGAGPGWWYRLPRLLIDELAEDAQRMELAP